MPQSLFWRDRFCSAAGIAKFLIPWFFIVLALISFLRVVAAWLNPIFHSGSALQIQAIARRCGRAPALARHGSTLPT